MSHPYGPANHNNPAAPSNPYQSPPVSGPVRHEAAGLLESRMARVGQSVEVYTWQTCRCGETFHGYDSGGTFASTLERTEQAVNVAMAKHTALHNATVVP